jgi:hypothetical protein
MPRREFPRNAGAFDRRRARTARAPPRIPPSARARLSGAPESAAPSVSPGGSPRTVRRSRRPGVVRLIPVVRGFITFRALRGGDRCAPAHGTAGAAANVKMTWA